MDTGNSEVQEPIFPKKICVGSLRSQQLKRSIFSQFLLLIYNSRTIIIISFLSQEYLQVFMYIYSSKKVLHHLYYIHVFPKILQTYRKIT